jgi:hypothetical protein
VFVVGLLLDFLQLDLDLNPFPGLDILYLFGCFRDSILGTSLSPKLAKWEFFLLEPIGAVGCFSFVHSDTEKLRTF